MMTNDQAQAKTAEPTYEELSATLEELAKHPYGDVWRKEIMKLSKDEIVDILQNSGRMHVDQSSLISGLTDENENLEDELKREVRRTAGLEEENKRKDETIKILDIKLVEKHVEIQGLEEERDRLLKRVEELESLLQIERLNHQKDHGFGF